MKLKDYFFMYCESKYLPRNDLPENLRDMLRYDIAFQHSIDKQLILFPTFKTAAGNLGGQVTFNRWDSFGVRLTNVLQNYLPTRTAMTPSVAPENWITYRHPVIGMTTDYSTLVPVTLKEVLSAGDLDAAARTEKR